MRALINDPKRGHIAAGESPFVNNQELTPALAEVVARQELAAPADEMNLAQIIWRIMQEGQVDKDGKVLQPPLPGVSIRHLAVEARATRLTKGMKNVRVIPEVFTPDAVRDELQGLFVMQDPKQVEADRKSHAKAAMEWLHKMATGELAGYPFADAEASLRQALQNPELAALAVDAVARLPGKDAQQDIANVVLGQLDPAIRLSATDALIKHIQGRGKMLSEPQLLMLLEKPATEADPQIRSRLLDLRGILQTDSKETGLRLLEFTPMPPAPPGEAKEKKEEPKN